MISEHDFAVGVLCQSDDRSSVCRNLAQHQWRPGKRSRQSDELIAQEETRPITCSKHCHLLLGRYGQIKQIVGAAQDILMRK